MIGVDSPSSSFAGPLAVFSRGILRTPGIESLLGATLIPANRFLDPARVAAVVGWGRRASSLRARAYASRHAKPFIALEDGFLRSLGLGGASAPLSVVVDDLGIYYDATLPCRLDRLCDEPLQSLDVERSLRFIHAWRQGRVSKYNHLPEFSSALPEDYVLVVDQTRGDASLQWGGADATTFDRMLRSALEQYPGSRVLVKTHPDVLAGKAKGCIDIAAFADQPRVELLAENAHPVRLLEHARAVFVATSQMGFEALLRGRPVHCFGMPFYAGRGLTRDAVPAPPWRQAIDLPRLVHAALLRYPRYLDPVTAMPCEAERVLEHLSLQRRLRAELPPVVEALGFSAWKRPLLRDFMAGTELVFRRRVAQVGADRPLVLWGASPAPRQSPRVLRVEDGFLRSVGLGAELARPLSWVIDDEGIYYDATRPSALENMLRERDFEPDLLERAGRLREHIVASGIGKYNLAGSGWSRPAGVARVVLVVGQVESDAAVALGATAVRDNASLLAATRERCPDAWIVYKPHPDVVRGLRKLGANENKALRDADEVVYTVSMAAMLDAVDEVHVISSLAGFEALLREKKVVCHGRPFYAGWGLTEDLDPPARRGRQLSVEQLVAAALILYPRYVHPRGRFFMSPEEAVEELLGWRSKPLIPLWRRWLLPLLRLRAR